MTSITVQFISMMALSLTQRYFYKGACAIVKYALYQDTLVRTTRMKQLESFAIYGENDSYYEQR